MKSKPFRDRAQSFPTGQTHLPCVRAREDSRKLEIPADGRDDSSGKSGSGKMERRTGLMGSVPGNYRGNRITPWREEGGGGITLGDSFKVIVARRFSWSGDFNGGMTLFCALNF
ncbi:hypothetical protein CDAR_424861 [Caerostris darwini]|uniref:Uncharacterized protein n=1 Tax=Caerostris darwini TaxID=1538125 RepID=A0AAV4U1X9_9ARAC|nr:hypothetical protein CDAR_424861 [Caerostris darwini]